MAEAKNASMVRVCPELASKYAAYPMSRPVWLTADGTGPNDAPGFIKTGDGSFKNDYVYGGRGDQRGYYHLLTRESYQILCGKITSTAAPAPCCGCSDASRQAMEDYQITKTIVYNRSVSRSPDDAQAAKDAIMIARQVANRTYNATQNQQLMLHAVFLAT